MPTDAGDWEPYSRALHAALANVLAKFPEEVRPYALEVANYSRHTPAGALIMAQRLRRGHSQHYGIRGQ